MVQRIAARLAYQCNLKATAGFCWLAVVSLVPLIFNPLGAYVFEPIKVSLFRSLAMMGLFAVLLGGSRMESQGRISTRWPQIVRYPLAVPVFFNAVICVLVTVFSIDPAPSFWGRCTKMAGAYTFLSYQVIWLTVVCCLQNRDQIRRVFTTTSVTSGLIAAYAIVQWLGLDPIHWQSNFGGRVFSTLGHPNTLGAYMAMTIPITIATAFLSRPWRCGKVVLFASLLTMQIGALVESNSRAGMAGAAIALVFVASVGILRSCRRSRFLPIAVVVLCLAVFAAAWLIPKAATSYDSFRWGRSNTIVSRLLIWQTSVNLASQRPVFGFGSDAFGVAFQSVYPPALAHFEGYGVIPDRAHNLFLDTLVMTGALGLAALLGFGVTFYVKVLSLIWRSDSFPWYMVGIVGAFTAYVVQGLFSFDVVVSGSLLWILVGGASVLLAESRGNAQKKPSQPARQGARPMKGKSWWLQVALVSIALGGVLLGNLRFNLANTWRGQGQRAAIDGDFRKSAAVYAKAAALCPECEEDLAYLANALLERFRNTGDVAFVQAAEQVLQLAQQRSLYEANHYANLGHLYLLWSAMDAGKLKEALNAYQQAVALRPLYPQYYDFLGLTYQMSGDLGAADFAFNQALNLDPLHVPTHVRLGELYLGQGNDDVARSHFRSAIDAYLAWSAIDPGIVQSDTFKDELEVAYSALDLLSGDESLEEPLRQLEGIRP